MSSSPTSFKIADLVVCVYDLFDYYEYFFDQVPECGYPFYGIIIEVQHQQLNKDQYGYDKIYIVRCFDGHIRFFVAWEMRLISTSS